MATKATKLDTPVARKRRKQAKRAQQRRRKLRQKADFESMTPAEKDLLLKQLATQAGLVDDSADPEA